METLKFILLVIAAIIVCGLMAIGVVRLVSWWFEVRYEPPKDTIWYIEESLEELYNFYAMEGNSDKQKRVEDIHREIQGLKTGQPV